MKITHIMPALVYVTVEAESPDHALPKINALAGGLVTLPNILGNEVTYSLMVTFSTSNKISESEIPNASSVSNG